MRLARAFLASTTASLMLLGTTATAELTATQVWQDWSAYLGGLGYEVSATQVQTDDTLSLSGIEVRSVAQAGASPVTLRVGALDLTENSDGSVDIILPAQFPIILDIPARIGAPAISLTMNYSQSGHEMSVSGTPDKMSYGYIADSFGLALLSFQQDGVALDDTQARFNLTGTDLVSRNDVTVGDARSYTQALSIGAVSYDLLFSAPDTPEAMSVQTSLNALTFEGSSIMPAAPALTGDTLQPLLTAGSAFGGTFDIQGSESQIELTSQDGTTRLKTGSARSTLGVAMGPEGLSYTVDAQQVQVGAQLAGLPFPLFGEMAQSGLEIQTPLDRSDAPQDFKLAFNMTDLTLSDVIWALFDASGTLPRDPATIAFDLRGKARVLVDPSDTQAMQQSFEGRTLPAELSTLKIETLLVDAVGARLEATGNLDFEAARDAMLFGYPKPVGEIGIDLAGANGLIENLVTMGILPVQWAMNARMMMGVITVPGDAPDTLRSTIEFTPEGQIRANGLSLQ
jgi:hypothetical protein